MPGAAGRCAKSSPLLNQMHGLKMPVDAVAAAQGSLYYELLPELKGHSRSPGAHRGEARPHPVGRRLRQPADSVVASLTALGLLDKFDMLVCAEDYTHGKPAPD